MSKIVGLGGVFLQFKGDEQKLKDWYQKQFELDMSDFGSGFIEGEQLTLLAFKRESDFIPLVNFRVDHLKEVIQDLKDQNVEIISEPKEYPYGYFAQFRDPFDNVVELWEPYIEEYKKMVANEIVNYKKKHKLK
jgi:lactoylglutathione lyase